MYRYIKKPNLGWQNEKIYAGVVFDTKITTELNEYFGSGRGRPVYSVDNGKWYEYVTWLTPMLGVYKLIHDTKQKISNITTPTLIFQSEKDNTVNYKSIYHFAKHTNSENTKLVVLKDSNHSYFTPEDLAVMQKLLLKFMK